MQSVASNFASGEFMHIRNSITAMTKIAGHFPLHYAAGHALLTAIDQLARTEKRDDVRILAVGSALRIVLIMRLLTFSCTATISYQAVLRKRSKTWLDQPAAVHQPVSDLAFPSLQASLSHFPPSDARCSGQSTPSCFLPHRGRRGASPCSSPDALGERNPLWTQV